MNIELPWGDDVLDLKVPDTWELIWPAPLTKSHNSDTGMDESLLVEQSLNRPIAMVPLETMDLKKKRILIVVDDNTRPTPVHRFFNQILDRLERAGADFDSITLMPALGIHTAMTQNQMEEKVGKESLGKISWKNHDAFDEKAKHNFGTTSIKRILKILGPARTLWFLETVKPGINVEEKFLLYYSMHLIRQYELLFHVPTLSDHEVKRLAMFKQFHHPQAVIDRAAEMIKTNSRVAVFPEAGATFPIVGQN